MTTEEKLKEEILIDIFNHYWWNIRGFSYRVNNSEELEREMLALAFEPFLDNLLRKPQKKEKINIKLKLERYFKQKSKEKKLQLKKN